MAIFRAFRRFLGALEAISEQLRAVVIALIEIGRLQSELGPARARLEALELSRVQFEAGMEGLVLKAEGKFKAANNAEARERQLKKSYERLADEIDLGGAEPKTPEGDPVLNNDAQAGEAERLHTLHLGVAPLDGKALALNHKWSR